MTPKVVLLAHTPTPEQTVAAAARLCYSDTDVEALRESISQERAEQFVEMLDGFGHESPVEHVTFTFGIEGVSRSFLAQVTRHRIASYSVQSQRYVRQDPFVYITPPAIAADPALLADYQNVMQQAIDSYNRLADEYTLQVFDRLSGLNEGAPIHENYGTHTGERLKAPHFSWSSSHLLMMYDDYGK